MTDIIYTNIESIKKYQFFDTGTVELNESMNNDLQNGYSIIKIIQSDRHEKHKPTTIFILAKFKEQNSNVEMAEDLSKED